MWVEPQKNGTYRFMERYTDPYTGRRERTGITLNSQSKQAHNKARRLLQEKIDELTNTRKKSDFTFGEVKHEWKKEYKKKVKPKSYIKVGYSEKIFGTHIKNDYLIENIDYKLIQECLDFMYYDEDYSFSYVDSARTILNMIFKYAKREKIIVNNPIEDTRLIPKPKTIEQLESIENKYLTPEELALIVARQRSTHNGKRKGDFTQFLAETGMRYGEMIALKVSDYDGEAVTVRGTIDYTTKKISEAAKDTTKNETIRVVPLTDVSIEIIERMIEENKLLATEKRYNDRGYIFTSFFGNPATPSTFNDSLKIACYHVGITKNVTSHYLRHTHISVLAEENINLKTIMERVGHKDADTTLKIYTHVTEKMKTNLLTKLNNRNKKLEESATFLPHNDNKE